MELIDIVPCSRGSFVPYILALHLVLVRPSSPTAIANLCELLLAIFDHFGFLPFSM